MTDSRAVILARIRNAIRSDAQDRLSTYDSIPRQFQTTGTLTADDRLALFEDRLRDYGSRVYRCTEPKIAGTVAQVMVERPAHKMARAGTVPSEWLPKSPSFVNTEELRRADLDALDGVLTRCAVAVAATGTIILRHPVEHGSRATSLIPDYHLCVVHLDQIVETLSEAIKRLQNPGAGPITTISGPSATSDIEMTRVKGVHGPRTLDVIVVLEKPQA